MKKQRFLLVATGILFFSLQNSVYSQFQGHTAKGAWGLQSGSQISEGFLIAPVYINYSSSKLMNKDGEEVRNITGAERDLSVNGAGLLAWWVSKYKFFGANYGIMATLSFLGNSIEFATKEFKTKFGMADFYLQPINLGWHFRQLDVVASYGIYFPTGRYDADASDIQVWECGHTNLEPGQLFSLTKRKTGISLHWPIMKCTLRKKIPK